ncbi:MAG: tRNA (adenosine(37)-N6)-threonylcarbamoyltransferase complex ATPase subunit type 1 TsaE [Clostridia bacterium]|nr:tRNA (adenosine(37)-N6)-threonylcarbamoyltransferase complex ATPase subunit type 1 TsaE [Clostridia bacterium]
MISTSEQQTLLAGEEFSSRLRENDIVCLHGEPGVGKSVFVRGVARGLGITEDITSPTFTLVNEYHSGRLALYHFDMYRLESGISAEDAGLDEYFDAGGVCMIEWAEHIEDVLPGGVYHVLIERDLSRGEEFRRITWKTI